jgi:hypothetical protein
MANVTDLNTLPPAKLPTLPAPTLKAYRDALAARLALVSLAVSVRESQETANRRAAQSARRQRERQTTPARTRRHSGTCRTRFNGF